MLQAREKGRVYKIAKLMCGSYSEGTDAPIMDKQGRLLMTEAEQDVQWTEHFNKVLNRTPPPTEADIHEAETDLDVNPIPQEKKRS